MNASAATSIVVKGNVSDEKVSVNFLAFFIAIFDRIVYPYAKLEQVAP